MRHALAAHHLDPAADGAGGRTGTAAPAGTSKSVGRRRWLV